MKYRWLTFMSSFLIFAMVLLQSHSDGRATRNRDNTGAPNGQMSGNGTPITCQNCHEDGALEVGLNLELLDSENNAITSYVPNEVYTAKVTIETISGGTPTAYGFQMVSLLEADNSDVDGWIDAQHSDNVQLVLANSTGRVYAEHDGSSASNEFTAEWTAPDTDSGDISFYVAGIGANGNGASSGDHAPTPIKITFGEATTTSTPQVDNDIAINFYPNPTSDILNISGDLSNKTVEIYQYHTLVKSITSKGEQLELPMTDLTSGQYTLVIRSKDNKIVAIEKVVKI